MEMEKRIENLEQNFEKIMEKLNNLEKKNSSPPVAKQQSKFISFEKAFEKCEKYKNGEKYPCMYLPKSGKNKDHCCGADATLVLNEEDEQVEIDGKVEKKFFHSLRCNACRSKGNSDSSVSKKKCEEKIRGIDVKSTSNVNQEALSFLAGTPKNIPSPSGAYSKKSLPEGTSIEFSDHFDFIVPFNNNNFVFEVEKNKSGSPCKRKTPKLKGYITSEEVDKDSYQEEIEEKIPEKIIKELNKVKKFKFEEENIVKEDKKAPILPQINNNDEEDNEENKLNEDDMDDILENLNVE